jgi:type VI secretion system protein VasG
MSTPLKTLIAKLDALCLDAATRAASLCLARGHYEVDLEHLFLALLDDASSDLGVVLRTNRLSADTLRRDLERELGRLKTGNTRTPVFSPHLIALFEQAWLIASLDAHAGRIRSGHLLLALLSAPDLAQFAQRMSSVFAEVPIEALKHKFDEATAGSHEAPAVPGQTGMADEGPGEGGAMAGLAAPGASKTPALDTYTTNLTQRAREGRIDPVIGREAEIRQTIDILMRRRQNNPILTGEAGVGKTAVVEGLALRIAADDVPEPLKGVALHVLDMGLLQAGASVKGEFENRLKNVIDEVKKSVVPIVLFIDEAHTIIGAGGQAGQNDAANLLKPALARGELRTIAATTWSEYRKYFEKDVALARRFQVVKIDEPGEALAAAMVRGLATRMEAHFNVRILDEAITEAVRLSHRYITGRQLPDKAIGVLDTACAKVALAHGSTPAAIDDARKRIERIDAEIASLEREVASGSAGAAHDERLAELRASRAADVATLAADEARYEQERGLVTRIGELRAQIETAGGDEGDAASARAALAQETSALQALQQSRPMVPLQVDGHVVAEIVASWTGIPLGRMVKDEIRTVLGLKDLLAARVIGQEHALDAIAQRVRTASANLEDPNKPRGVFLFVGPSGVGKTETALALADILYGGERKLITINMSEYQEAHSVSGLKGSPPGYVGYGEGGVLTEAVRRNPYSVVLLDEIEKAHPDVLEMFFQVFDKGTLDDAEGREIDFRHALIILTSNVGSSTVMQACLNKQEGDLPNADTLSEMLRPQLYKAFKPAFLGRVKVIPYYPISDDVLAEIIELKLGRIRDRIAANHRAQFSWDESLVDAVLARCTEVDSGARNVDHILNGTLLPELAQQVLGRVAEGARIERIAVRAGDDGEFEYKVA